MKILAVEDDFLAASALEMFIRKLGYELIEVTNNSEDFLRLWKATKPDLALVDIDIRGNLDGIEIAEKISQSDNPIPIIFITSIETQETFERAKNLNPFAFMLKPFEELNLQRAIELAVHKYIHNIWDTPEYLNWKKDLAGPKSFFIKVGQKLQKIKTEEIDFIKAEGKHCIVFSKEESYNVKLNLVEVAQKLPANHFMRVHRSYIINLEQIQNINLKSNSLTVGENEIPYSAAYKKELFDRLDFLG